jgi:hypothetical protein
MDTLNLENISTHPTKTLEKYQRAITKELEKRSGSELKAIRKQLAKLAEMTGMRIIEEEEVVSASEEISTESIEAPSPSVREGEKEENEVAVSAPEETPPPAGGPVEAGKPSGEEEAVPLEKKKRPPVPRRKSRTR